MVCGEDARSNGKPGDMWEEALLDSYSFNNWEVSGTELVATGCIANRNSYSTFNYRYGASKRTRGEGERELEARRGCNKRRRGVDTHSSCCDRKSAFNQNWLCRG